MSEFILAIDGGGTKCKAKLYASSGMVIAEGLSGPANVFTDFEGACDSIMDGANQCLHTASKTLNQAIGLSDIVLSAGCAGANTAVVQSQFQIWQSPFAKKYLISDLHATCLSANSGKACSVVIVGTGSSIAGFSTTKVTQYGGHGFQLGDQASGAWLGKQALQVCLRHFDGFSVDAEFVQSMLTHLDTKQASDIVAQYAHAAPGDYARLAGIVFALSEQGNACAQDIIDIACKYIIDIISLNNLMDLGPCLITGGLATSYAPYLHKAQDFAFKINPNLPEHGAYLYALSQLK